jgi:hypothetical protein
MIEEKQTSELETEIDALPDSELKTLIKEWQKTIVHAPMSLSLFYYKPNMQYILNNKDNPNLIKELKKAIEHKSPEYGRLIYTLGDKFKRTFNLPLKNYIDLITGFDIVKFDEDIKTPDGISTKDFISKTYGEEAVKLIQSLI